MSPGTKPPAPPSPKTTIGEYEVLHRIGAGGMGDVYEARHPVIGRKVAIKVLKKTAPRGPEAPPTLLSEARAANLVHHPHIVEVFGFGQLPNGQEYLVMEMLDGSALEKLLEERKRLEIEEGLSILEELFDALAALHGVGAVHRDLKPANVFVVKPPHGDPYVKLLDFGLAQAGPTAPSEVLWGTLQYLGPEQLRGEPATAASDLFAAGAVAYKLFSGSVPFDGRTPDELVAQHRRAPKALSSVVPEVPLRLSQLVSSLLDSNPARRPSAVKAFEEVRALQRHLRPAATPPPQTAPAPAKAAPGLLDKVFSQFRKGPAPAPAPAAPAPAAPAPAAPAPAAPAAPAPAVPPEPEPQATGRRRATEVGSLDLLSLADLAPADRAPDEPYTAGLEQVVIERSQDQLDEARLPAFPWVASRVVELSAQEDAGAGDLVQLINQDPALTAQVLRAANSAAASRGIEIRSAREAITRLGVREVTQVVLAASTHDLFAAGAELAPVREARRRLWLHSMTCAFTSTWLALETKADAQRAFLGGMLHDIGKLLAMQALETLVADGALPPDEVSGALGPLLEATHNELGRRMCESWKLPAHVGRICAEHHAPKLPVAQDREIHIVRLAAGLTEIGTDPHWFSSRVEEVRESAVALGMDRVRLRTTTAKVQEFAKKTSALASSLSVR